MSIEQIIEDLKKWMSDRSNDKCRLSVNTYKNLYDIIEGKYKGSFIIMKLQRDTAFDIETELEKEMSVEFYNTLTSKEIYPVQNLVDIYYIYFNDRVWIGKLQLNSPIK